MGKFRQKYGQFVVEGLKSVTDLIHSDYETTHILVTPSMESSAANFKSIEIVSEKTMEKLTQQDTAPGILAVAKTKSFPKTDIDFSQKITVALDAVSNPGNLGTIIRTADWYGINQFIFSEGCADFYNIKTLMATMGSFVRAKFTKANLSEILVNKNTVGCFLDGKPVHQFVPESPLILVIGSESKGISAEVENIIKHKVTITGAGNTAESLNAAMAAGIVMDRLFHN